MNLPEANHCVKTGPILDWEFMDSTDFTCMGMLDRSRQFPHPEQSGCERIIDEWALEYGPRDQKSTDPAGHEIPRYSNVDCAGLIEFCTFFQNFCPHASGWYNLERYRVVRRPPLSSR